MLSLTNKCNVIKINNQVCNYFIIIFNEFIINLYKSTFN